MDQFSLGFGTREIVTSPRVGSEASAPACARQEDRSGADGMGVTGHLEKSRPGRERPKPRRSRRPRGRRDERSSAAPRGRSGGELAPFPLIPDRSKREKTRRHFIVSDAARGPTRGSPGLGGPVLSRHLIPCWEGDAMAALAPGHLQSPTRTFNQCGPPPFSGGGSFTHKSRKPSGFFSGERTSLSSQLQPGRPLGRGIQCRVAGQIDLHRSHRDPPLGNGEEVGSGPGILLRSGRSHPENGAAAWVFGPNDAFGLVAVTESRHLDAFEIVEGYVRDVDVQDGVGRDRAVRNVAEQNPGYSRRGREIARTVENEREGPGGKGERRGGGGG